MIYVERYKMWFPTIELFEGGIGTMISVLVSDIHGVDGPIHIAQRYYECLEDQI